MNPLGNRKPETEGQWFEKLTALARYLRGPDGCPWDREQTSASFARYAAEEAGELVEAVDEDDNAHIAEEMGDTLFVLLASATAAEEEGRFSVKDVLAAAHEKMVRRHAHVFGEEKAESAEAAIDSWNRIKELENKD